MGAQDTNGKIDGFITELSDLTKRVSYPDNISVDRSHKTYELIVARMTKFFDADRACLAYVDPDEPTNMFRLYTCNYGTEESPGWWRRLSSEGNSGQVGIALESPNGIHFAHDIKPKMANYVPIHSDTQAQATLTVCGKAKNTDTLVLIFEFRDSISDESKSKIINSWPRLQRLLTRFEEHIFFCRGQFVLDTLSGIGQSRDEESALKRILDLAMKVTGDGEAAILKRYASRLKVNAHRGIKNPELVPRYIDIGLEKKSGYTAFVAWTQKSYTCRDTQDTEKYKWYRSVDTETLSQFTIPLVFRSELVGVLNIGNDRPYAFSHIDLKLMESIARHAAYVLYNLKYREDNDFLAKGIVNSLSPWSLWKEEFVKVLRAGGINKKIVNLFDRYLDVTRRLSKHVESIFVKNTFTSNIGDLIAPKIRKLRRKETDENFELTWHNKLPEDLKNSSVFVGQGHFEEIINHLSDIVLIEVEGDKKEYINVELGAEYHPIDETVSYITLTFRLEEPNNHLRRLVEKREYSDLLLPVTSNANSKFLEDAQLKLWRLDRLLASYGGFLGVSFSKSGHETVLTAHLKPNLASEERG